MTSPEYRSIEVSCYAGYRPDESPRRLTLPEGKEVVVLGIADRWYDPETDYFRVRGDDGHGYLIGHRRRDDTWFLVQRFPSQS